MAFRIQLGSSKGRTNAFCYVPIGRCKLVRVGAFAEHPGLSRLFYGLLLESLRSWAPVTYLQVPSSASWWGRRRRDAQLAPKPPVHTTAGSLLFDVCDADDLKTFTTVFWHRSPLRVYGASLGGPVTADMASLLDKELLAACRPLASGDLRFVVERDAWGFFPNVLFAAANVWAVARIVRDAGRVLSSPLERDEDAFSRFPIRFLGSK